MSGAAQQTDMIEELGLVATGTQDAAGLRQVVSERLEAHRRRRAAVRAAARVPEAEAAERQSRTRATGSRVREAVAARYRDSVTYREFLEQEAERALEKAQAEAEVAARNVQAVAAAQMQLLEELQQWNQDAVPSEPAPQPPAGTSKIEAPTATSNAFAAGLTVRLYEDFSAIRPAPEGERSDLPAMEADASEVTALDAEIAFRRAPEFEPHRPEPVGIAGNLIEFPRQLVAARKARPRLAEGPLREESAPEPQLRIFEVEPEQISASPAEPASAPAWQSIVLEGVSGPAPIVRIEAQMHYTIPPQTAGLGLRLMAAAVDACCVGAALVAFAAVGASLAGPALRNLPMAALAGSATAIGCALFIMYQLLFFTFNEATPGMRYARIGLCTFGDDNPTRSALRRRVLASLLAACPLGLGLVWAFMDDDSLGWHDRISRMYQRGY